MKKIMFNDKYRLTQAVLEGIKTQTRRIMNPQPEDCSTVHRWYKSAYWKDKPMSLVVNEDGSVYCEFCGYGAKLEGGSIFRLPYKVGEIVAVAQSYNSFYNDECNPNLFPNGAGWTNGDTLIAVKEAHPDSEIYQIKINEFILVDSIGIWYVNANMGIKEPYTEKQLVKLWNNHGRN